MELVLISELACLLTMKPTDLNYNSVCWLLFSYNNHDCTLKSELVVCNNKDLLTIFCAK